MERQNNRIPGLLIQPDAFGGLGVLYIMLNKYTAMAALFCPLVFLLYLVFGTKDMTLAQLFGAVGSDIASNHPIKFYLYWSFVWLYFWKKLSGFFPQHDYFRRVYLSFCGLLPVLFFTIVSVAI